MFAKSLHTKNLTFDLADVRPTAPALAIRCYVSGCWTVVEADGELDIQGMPLMRQHLAGNPTHLVFDLSRVTFMDASMLGVLVSSWRKAARGQGRVLVVGGTSRAVRRLLLITRLDQVVPIFDSLGEALAAAAVDHPDAC